MARALHLKSAPVLVTSTRRHAQLGITRLSCEQPGRVLSLPIPREDAYLVTVQLKHIPYVEMFWGTRQMYAGPYSVGATTFLDLQRDPIAYLINGYDSLQFYLPRAALNELADEHGARSVEELSRPDGIEIADPVVQHLAYGALPALEHPERANPLFIQHLALALGVHVLHNYSGARIREPVNGGLAPWQLARATELLREHLDGNLPLARLAAECNLSRSHFTRAFKASTGLPPHQWLLARRVERAKDLMRTSELPLSEIALACGFSEQAHLTRVFSRSVGLTPSAWRRAQWRETKTDYWRSSGQTGPPARGTE
jgi:AraC-like DNA-binding protein